MLLLVRITATCGLLFASLAAAQQVTFATPNYGASDSFYTNSGIRLGIQYDGPTSRFYFRNSGGTPPAFGGFDPNSQANFGVAGRRGNWSWSLGATAGVGSSQNRVVTTPILTLPNGGFGSIWSGTSRPFVTGIIPVVNDNAFADPRAAHRQRIEVRFARALNQVEEKKLQEQESYRELKRQLSQSRAEGRSPKRKMDEPLVLRPDLQPTSESPQR